MRVEFVGHATLWLRLGELSILTDPWWSGPAYRGQWYPYPAPVPERVDLPAVDAIYISHGHEDHLHRETLAEILRVNPAVAAVIPRRYDTSMRDYLRRIGFRTVHEVPGDGSLVLRHGADTARLRVFTHMDDSLLTVEHNGRVLVNANDALHASRRELIEAYCQHLRGGLPPIDYLFCAFGGASYFPNCIHCPDKDDAQVARAREEFFLRNFALIADRLAPKFAFPFAAHFVLPDERNWWISASRLRMAPPAEIVRRLAPGLRSRVYDLQPGDWVVGDTVHASPFPRRDPDAVRAEVRARYGPPLERAAPDAVEFERLLVAVRARVAERAGGPPLDARLDFWDYPAAAIRIRVREGLVDVAVEPGGADGEPDVVLGTRTDLVWATMQSPFGRDLITIGYAADVRLRSGRELQSSPHERLLNLLGYQQPRWRQRLRVAPLRVLGFVRGDLSMRRQLRVKFGRGQRAVSPRADDPRLYEIGDWAQAPE
jgi:hypothetical protein